ncbi:aminotransferase family protein [Sphingobium xenophagum]|uniref:aminotransferase family protein n=1 Tax=Sphingobium xenophagum TaxID=121428 RepID=UPI0003A8AE9F|nr:aminotransferase class III-fold pyridoxal phosphate-dependent enzyme [Sphingobium xenophagum]
MNASLAMKDQRSLFHAVTSIADNASAGPFVLTKGKGCIVTDEHGRDYIDMGAGLWCVNIGYGRSEVADAIADATRSLNFQHLFGGAASVPAIELADRLLTLFRTRANAPEMARVFFGSSGSDANDTAYKLVLYYHNLIGKPLKKKVISRQGAYHGLTYAAGSLTGIDAYHKAFDMPAPGVLHVEAPHYYRGERPGESEADFSARLVADLRATIEREGPDTIAAFWAEPVMGTGGVIPPPTGYFEGVQKLLAEHEILFVADEVITGFGRTGSWFGTGHYGLKPDIVNLAKGITSAYLPLSATIISNRIWDVLEHTSATAGAFMHGFTYSGHPVCCAAALAVLDIMESEDVVGPVVAKGERLLAGLRSRLKDHPFVGDIRGVGLMAGVEYMADPAAKRDFAGMAGHKIVAGHARTEGILTRALPWMPVTAFSPPLIISDAELDEALDRYVAAAERAIPALEAMASA